MWELSDASHVIQATNLLMQLLWLAEGVRTINAYLPIKKYMESDADSENFGTQEAAYYQSNG